MISICLWYI